MELREIRKWAIYNANADKITEQDRTSFLRWYKAIETLIYAALEDCKVECSTMS
jgi:hypothetical protein